MEAERCEDRLGAQTSGQADRNDVGYLDSRRSNAVTCTTSTFYKQSNAVLVLTIHNEPSETLDIRRCCSDS